MQQIDTTTSFMFHCWVDPVVHLLLLKSSMIRLFHTDRITWLKMVISLLKMCFQKVIRRNVNTTLFTAYAFLQKISFIILKALNH